MAFSYKTFINLVHTTMITFWAQQGSLKSHSIPNFDQAGGNYGEVDDLVRKIINSNPAFDTESWSDNINASRDKKNEKARNEDDVKVAVNRVSQILHNSDLKKLHNLTQAMNGSVYGIAVSNQSTTDNDHLVYSVKSGAGDEKQHYFVYIPAEDLPKVDLDSSLSVTRYINSHGYMNCTIAGEKNGDVRIVNGQQVKTDPTVRVYGKKTQLQKFLKFLNYGDKAVIVDATPEQIKENGKCRSCLVITGDKAEEFKKQLIGYTSAAWRKCVHFLAVSKVTEQQYSELMGDKDEQSDLHGNKNNSVDADMTRGAKELQELHGDDTRKMLVFGETSKAIVNKIDVMITSKYHLKNEFVAYNTKTPFNSLCAEINRISECIWQIDPSTEFIKIAMEAGKNGTWEDAPAKAYMAKTGTNRATDKAKETLVKIQQQAYKLLEATEYVILKDETPVTFDSEFPVVQQKAATVQNINTDDTTDVDDQSYWEFSGDTAGEDKSEQYDKSDTDSTEEFANLLEKAENLEKQIQDNQNAREAKKTEDVDELDDWLNS